MALIGIERLVDIAVTGGTRTFSAIFVFLAAGSGWTTPHFHQAQSTVSGYFKRSDVNAGLQSDARDAFPCKFTSPCRHTVLCTCGVLFESVELAAATISLCDVVQPCRLSPRLPTTLNWALALTAMIKHYVRPSSRQTEPSRLAMRSVNN